MSLLDDASIIITPNGVKASKLYAYKPSNGNGDMTWARNSIAERRNSVGVLESSAINVPRINYPIGSGCPSILLEPQRTNLYLNSAVLVGQSVSTVSDVYTVSFYGTGTINFTGSFVGSLVGTGINDKVSLTFTTTLGTLINIVSLNVFNAQIELGGYSTSYITTLGSTVTRLKDVGSNCGTLAEFDSNNGTLFFEFKNHSVSEIYDKSIVIQGSNTNDAIVISFQPNQNSIKILGVSGGVLSFNATANIPVIDFLSFSKYTLIWDGLDIKLHLNSVLVLSGTLSIPFVSNSFIKLNLFNGIQFLYGELKQLQVYKRVLTLTEIQAL